MTSPSTIELSTVRQRLTKLTDRLLLRLHDRAGFPLNRPVYEAGAIPIPGRSGVSLFSFAITWAAMLALLLAGRRRPLQFGGAR